MNTQLKTISNYYLEEDLIYDFYNNQILLNQESIISHEQHSQQLYEQQYNYQNEIDYMDISFENYKSFSEFQNDEEEEGEVVDQNEQEEEEEYFIWSENDLFEVSINTNIDYFEGQQLDFNFTYRQRTIFTQPKKLCDLDAAKELSFQFQHFNKNISFDELKQNLSLKQSISSFRIIKKLIA
ncbi:hypothetical protein ABPG74_012079 [Tetrahymena malaccensis]